MNKQTHYINMKYMVVILSFCLCSKVTKAQDNQSAGSISDSSAINQLAARLSISKEKTAQIRQAFNARRENIDQLAKDTAMNAKQKQQQLKSLLAQRKQIISMAISPAEKEQLKQINATAQQNRQQTIQQRHQQQLARMSHQQSQTIPMDVLKPKILPSAKQQ